VSPVSYELDFIPQKTTFFIVTAVETSSLTYQISNHIVYFFRVSQVSFRKSVSSDVLHLSELHDSN
jgi:hypothetical protein